MKRLAVILVGEYRTWAIAHRYLFKFFDSRAQQVDYFFVTWNVSSQTGELIPVTDTDITTAFAVHNKNLVDYKILEPIGKHRSTFYNQAYLSKVGNLLKRKSEHTGDFVYDQVVETRPDCYFRANDKPWVLCTDYEYEGAAPGQWKDGFMGIQDVYFRSSSFGNDLMSDRYYFKRDKDYHALTSTVHWEFSNHHWMMCEILFKRLLKQKSIESEEDFEFFCAVRPNFPTHINLDKMKAKELDNLFIGWGRPYDNFFYGPTSTTPKVDND
jgi:hypothetical protein